MSGSLVDGKWNQQRKKNAIKMMYFGLEFMECEGKKRILRISALLSDLIAFFEPGIRAETFFCGNVWPPHICEELIHIWDLNLLHISDSFLGSRNKLNDTSDCIAPKQYQMYVNRVVLLLF